MYKKFKFLGLTAALALAMTLAACGGDDEAESDSGSSDGDGDSEGLELGGKDIEIPYIAWAGSTSRSPVLAKALEEAGYNVQLTQVDAGPMFTSTADDEDTLNASGWLPATHEDYLDKYGDDLEVYEDSNFIDTAPLSLAVPEYMDVDSIEDLKDNDELNDELDGKITGIDPGAGIMESTEKALDNYDLDDWELQESSESAMISELQKRYDKEEPIIVTGWKPHWMFADMDLKMLDDPDEIYGGDGDQIQLVFNADFKDEHPAAYEIATRMADDWSEDDEDELMEPIFVEDEDEEEVAEDFIEEHSDRVDEWLEGVDKE